ncbi:hypothetical protein GGF46_001355 [Coemansia sp. RSA 552]|nr:hypothetical protein GGF46_001355 [Coemansia sp. RSA 552]
MGRNSGHDASVRRFREAHYHRFRLGTRSNIHGTCVLRSRLPVRLPRPHSMQQLYKHAPPGVGPARESSDSAAIDDERRRVGQWLAAGRGDPRTHVVVAMQTGLLFVVAGFGYWNMLDIDLHLSNEACVGVKAFEVPGGDGEALPAVVVALTTYVKRSSETRETDESGSYCLYALGAESLPPLAEGKVEAGADDPESGPEERAFNGYAYLEERLFALGVTAATPRIDLGYLPFRISHDVAPGRAPVLLVAGNDKQVHRYALGSDGIVEIEALLCPKTDVEMTFTAFDARVIGPYHVQITAHQEFAVALQASIAAAAAAGPDAATEGTDAAEPGSVRKLLVADEEVYDAAPVLTTVFTPDTGCGDRTAFDYAVTHRLAHGPPLGAGEVYNAKWPLGGADISTVTAPRVHALVAFVGEDAVVYRDVPVAGLDPAPTLVGSSGGANQPGRRGGVYALGSSSREGLVTAVHFDDVDLDGTKEVIVGTVSGAVLIYKDVGVHGYALVWRRRFPAPVYGIFSADINGDGANELVVVTLVGVHIMQPNLAHVRAKLLRRLLAEEGKE